MSETSIEITRTQSKISMLETVKKIVEDKERAFQVLLQLQKEITSNPQLKEDLRNDPVKVLTQRGLPQNIAVDLASEVAGISLESGCTGTCVCSGDTTVTL